MMIGILRGFDAKAVGMMVVKYISDQAGFLSSTVLQLPESGGTSLKIVDGSRSVHLTPTTPRIKRISEGRRECTPNPAT